MGIVRPAAALLIAATLAACSTGEDYRPRTADGNTNADPAYAADFKRCQSYARVENPMRGGIAGLILGTAGGALIGGLLGGLGDDSDAGIVAGATLGGAAGFAGGTAISLRERDRRFDFCMRSLGHEPVRVGN